MIVIWDTVLEKCSERLLSCFSLLSHIFWTVNSSGFLSPKKKKVMWMFGASSDFIFSFKIQLCEDSRAYSLTVKCERRRIKISSYWWYLKSALISDVKESISSNSMEMRKAEKRGNLLCIHTQFYHLASSWVDFPWWLHFSVFLNLWKRSLEMRRKKKKKISLKSRALLC